MAYQWSALLTLNRFDKKVPLLPFYDVDFGIRTLRKHYLTFAVSRPILLVGFGVYGLMTANEVPVCYGIYRNDLCASYNLKNLIDTKTENVYFDGHRNVTPLRFTQPVLIAPNSPYVLYLNVNGYNTFRGINGNKMCLLDDLRFRFLSEFDPHSLTTVAAGNIPELYFHSIISKIPRFKIYRPKNVCDKREEQTTEEQNNRKERIIEKCMAKHRNRK